MESQGLVSIMCEGKVAMKIIAGFNGMKAQLLGQNIRRLRRFPTLDEAYDLALEKGFGSKECLVVITNTEIRHAPHEELPERYRQTFHQPFSNPRLSNNAAQHVAIVAF